MVVSVETKRLMVMISEMGEEGKKDYSDLNLALEKLDEDEMELIELRYFEKHPFKEIGEILDITENNAKVKTYRVIDKLKKLLQHGK
jgi:RNA polymerase sigma-70 factor (ECF subfamily)